MTTKQTECCEKCKIWPGDSGFPNCTSSSCPCHKETDSVDAIVEEFRMLQKEAYMTSTPKPVLLQPEAVDWLRKRLTTLEAQNQRKTQEAYTKGRSDEAKTCEGCKQDHQRKIDEAVEAERERILNKLSSQELHSETIFQTLGAGHHYSTMPVIAGIVSRLKEALTPNKNV